MVLIFAVLFTGIGVGLASLIFGIQDLPAAISAHLPSSDSNLANALLTIQFFSALGTFIIAPLAASYLISDNVVEYVGLTKKSEPSYFIISFFLVIGAVPFINWMLALNSSMHLPESMKSVEIWMQTSEDNAAALLELFTNKTSLLGLIGNLLILALLPAIGEELLFRGLIQKLFTGLTKNKHASVFLTAILFSAFHMQFFGFIPRFALGLLLGYMMLWTGSLWLSMFTHFINNAFAVILTWLVKVNGWPANQDTFGVEPGQDWILGVSVFLTWTGVYLLHRAIKKQEIETAAN